jgi:hypothetical protein
MYSPPADFLATNQAAAMESLYFQFPIASLKALQNRQLEIGNALIASKTGIVSERPFVRTFCVP